MRRRGGVDGGVERAGLLQVGLGSLAQVGGRLLVGHVGRVDPHVEVAQFEGRHGQGRRSADYGRQAGLWRT